MLASAPLQAKADWRDRQNGNESLPGAKEREGISPAALNDCPSLRHAAENASLRGGFEVSVASTSRVMMRLGLVLLLRNAGHAGFCQSRLSS